MKTKDFLKKHSACKDGAKWALSISDDMADVWDAMIKDGKYAWLIWTLSRPGVFPESVLRKLACRVVRETPLADGRKVWDLLTDERSRIAIEVAELYADGKATETEMAAAAAAAYEAAAYPASRAAYATSRAAYAADAAAYAGDADSAARCAAYAGDAAYAADADAYSAADSAAYAAAKSAQVRMIAEMGNPFKERAESEGAGMRIYKFLQHEEWPVLIAAENRSKAKYQLYRFAQMMSRGGYDSFMECLKDFKSAGTISYEEAQKLIDADDCDADFGVHKKKAKR